MSLTRAGASGTPDVAAKAPGYKDTAAQWDPASVFSPGTGSTVDEAASFHSSNAELDAVFSLMERSAQFAGQQAYEDSPDRQEGQFTGDGTNESQAEMETLDERTLTREFIHNLIDSQQALVDTRLAGPGLDLGVDQRDLPGQQRLQRRQARHP